MNTIELKKQKKMEIPSGHNFSTCYINLCKQQRLRPLSIICTTLPYSLDFTTDRIKIDDWGPILNSLSLDQSLKSVCVRSHYQYGKSFSDMNNARRLGKPPVIFTQYLLEWLSHSIAQCLRNSNALIYLELEGIPLPADCLAALCVGLSSTKTLQFLSLRRCYIGNKCCDMVCKTISNIQCIKSLDLSQCDLTSNCGVALASVISQQKLLLYHDTWKDSLRCREPNFDAMGGLRRLTLNGNPHLGNIAVAQIIDVIQDSLWLKAFDIQNCGLTDSIGNKILKMLDHNKILQVIDVRLNFNLDETIVQEIFDRLEVNNIGIQTEYKFLSLTLNINKNSYKDISKRKNKHIDMNSETQPCRTIIQNKKNSCRFCSQSSINTRLIVKKKLNEEIPFPSTTVAPKLNNNIQITKGKISKISLRLDLKSQVCSEVDDLWKRNQMSTNKLKNTSESTVNKQTIAKFNDIFEESSDAKKKGKKLIEIIELMECELRKDSARREASKTKIWDIQQNLINLKNAMKIKKLESCGCLLINQQSNTDISLTFKQLLKVLDDSWKKSNMNRCHTDEEKIQGDFRQQFAFFIQKSNSEKLYSQFNDTQTIMNYSKSESDMKNLSPITSSIHLEKNIGDHPDTISLTISSDNNNCIRNEKLETIFPPCERARAIFTEIINGKVCLNLNTHVS